MKLLKTLFSNATAFSFVAFLSLVTEPLSLNAQRMQQPLDRGVVAVYRSGGRSVTSSGGTGSLISWRKLAQEPEGTTYNIYRRAAGTTDYTKMNDTPLKVTNYKPTSLTNNTEYAVTAISPEGVEGAMSKPFLYKTQPWPNVWLNIDFDNSVIHRNDYRTKFGLETVDNYCVLAALATPGVGFNFNQLKNLPLTANEVVDALNLQSAVAEGAAVAPPTLSANAKKTLGKYCINKNELVASGKTNPVVGFEREIASFFEILGRKTKSNLLIIGESGVGKTALINGFVARLLTGNVPSFLQGAIVYELDLAALASGAVNNMETEDRLRDWTR